MTAQPPATIAGRAMLRYLDDIGASPLSDVSFPDADDRILAIEAEARADALDRIEKLDAYHGYTMTPPNSGLWVSLREIRAILARPEDKP